MKLTSLLAAISLLLLSCNTPEKQNMSNRLTEIDKELHNIDDSLQGNLKYNAPLPINYHQRINKLQREQDSLQAKLKSL